MISIVSILLLSLTLVSFLIYGVINFVEKHEIFGFLLFLFIYLSVYLTLQILLFDLFGNSIILIINKLIKESLVLLLVLFWLFSRRDLLSIRPNWKLPDYLMLLFIAFPLMYAILPIGEATLLNKVLYFRGILMIGLMYFLGRVISVNKTQIRLLLRTILFLAVVAFLITLLEKITNTHFQSLIPYEAYQTQVNESEPTGNYGLTWTFEAASGGKRFAAFFSNPLEMAAIMILCGATALFLLLHEKHRLSKWGYGLAFACSIFTLVISFSRASFAGFILMLFFAALVMGYWRIIVGTIVLGFLFFSGLFLFGEQDLQYFIVDTLSFSESSSVGHIVEWGKAIESIITNPFGIGLATSGNSGSVDPDLQVGGENQYLIYGVQMGVPFMVLYIALLVSVIRSAIRTLKQSSDYTFATIPFVAATFKFAFLLPLMTSNAENFLFLSYISWWLAGISVDSRTVNSLSKRRKLVGSI